MTYKYNGKAGFIEDGSYKVSVVAQELQKAAPYMVNTFEAKLNEDDEEKTELLNYDGNALPFLLVNAVNQINQRLETLENGK